jgi:hypothetical protein
VGIPDRILLGLLDGESAFVELKAPGEEPSKIQLYWHKRLRLRGFKVAVIQSTKQFDRLLDWLSPRV